MYKTTIGLEIHIELKTLKKLFCNCKTNFNASSNLNTCPICLGMAGTLPKFNKKEVLPLAIKLGLALSSDISNIISFDRKHYFYKDLPKGFQTTQFFNPVLRNGNLQIKNKIINIKEIHIEEDAGKTKGDNIDFNRCGIPLLEIVTEPDFTSYEEVIEFLKSLREILLFLDISDAKIEEGSMRVDINISVSKDNLLGNRVEIKNVGSFKSIKNAILYEQERQIKLLEENNIILEHTRCFDENKNKTIFMRNKETIKDYKYLKEVDIKEIYIEDDFIENIRKNLPILPNEKRVFYKTKYNISDDEIDILFENILFYSIFEALCVKTKNPREVINLICGEFLKILNKENIDIKNLNITYIANLINIFLDEKITRDTYKKTFYEILKNNQNPEEYIEKNDLYLIDDENIIKDAIDIVLEENKKALDDYKNGNLKSLKFLLGATLKKLDYRANANIVNNILIDIIN